MYVFTMVPRCENRVPLVAYFHNGCDCCVAIRFVLPLVPFAQQKYAIVVRQRCYEFAGVNCLCAQPPASIEALKTPQREENYGPKRFKYELQTLIYVCSHWSI